MGEEMVRHLSRRADTGNFKKCVQSTMRAMSVSCKKNCFSYNQEKLRRLLSKKYYPCKSQAQKKTEKFSTDLDG